MTDVILLGDGEVARRWRSLIDRSPRLQLVARVGRSVVDADGDVPGFPDLPAALDAFPGARVAAAVPPRFAAEVAEILAMAGRAGVVQGPLHPGSVGAEPRAGDPGVQVADGWLTLPGMRELVTAGGAERLELTIDGLPGCPESDLEEVVWRGVPLIRRFLGDARVVAVRRPDASALELELEGRGEVRFRTRRPGLECRVRVPGGDRSLRWGPDQERVDGPQRGRPAARRVPDADVRALHQLLDPAVAGGESLTEGRAHAAWIRRELGGLRFPAGRRTLGHSARIMGRTGSALLPALGLQGALADGPAAPICDVSLPPLPLELASLRDGIKPVAFLTLRPEQVDEVLASVAGLAVERRDRAVAVGTQDRWDDRRDRGEPRVELYVSLDPGLAREAAALQADGDPSAALVELGRLMGYPTCCVQAFARQDDRSNNTRNRYFTAAGTEPAGVWPWELNNLFVAPIPFYPCSYRCEAAVAYARATLQAAEAEHPGLIARLQAVLARPVLYFDHEHQVILDADMEGARAHVRGAAVPIGTDPTMVGFAGALGAASSLELTDRALHVGDRSLPRTDPALGFLAPFGLAPSD